MQLKDCKAPYQSLAVALVLLLLASGSFATTPTQLKLVTGLYRDFAFEAVLEEPSAGGVAFVDQPKQVLLRYLTPTLADLLIRDRKCSAISQRVCKLDFSPLWASQDPIGAGVQISIGVIPDTVKANLRYPSGSRQLTYHLVKIGAVWRIRDISYSGQTSSLAELLVSQ
jgi:hypothetical protein